MDFYKENSRGVNCRDLLFRQIDEFHSN